MLLLTCILLGMVVVSLVLITKLKLFPWIAAQMVGIPYLFYLCFGYCSNSLNQYFSSMKPINHLEGVFEELRKRTGHIRLKAECYHFTGGKHRRRIVTHTAEQIIPVRECVDASEDIVQMKEDKRFLLCKIRRYYFFADANSHAAFLNTFAIFKNSNVQDKHQTYSHRLDITVPDFAEELGLSVHGTGGFLKPLFVVCLLLGLGYPYLMAVECMSQRYSINLTKRLSL
jgi:hypothetical protein